MTSIEEKKWKWTDRYLISSYEVDAKGKTPLVSLFKFMQETAYNHANHLEFGYDHLKSKGQFWVLSRLLVRIHRYPSWGETIHVSTWPSGVDGLFGIRDFSFSDEQNNKIGIATSSWLILDMEKHRPVRPDDLKSIIHLCPAERSMEEKPSKLQKLGNPEQAAFFSIKYSDLDLYRHVNNAKYIQFITDNYPYEFHENHEITELEVNFVSESKIGDILGVQTEKPGNSGENSNTPMTFLHQIVRKQDDREVCMARVIWK